MENVMKLIEPDLTKLEVSINRLVTTKVGFIKEIVNHIIKSGGKRVRPVLVILSARLCGHKDDEHIPYAAIVEFIHTATLLHDDVVDNAQTRRGASTANTIWGNEASVLVGDFLYAKSFELLADEGNDKIFGVMASTTKSLSEGEILELIRTSDIETSEEDYFEIIGNKTAVLFSVACEIGAILGKVDSNKKSSLKNFGYNLGMAFQLQDDILDYTSYDNVLGKRVGTDIKEGKVTLPLIYAIKSSNDKEKFSIQKVLKKSNVTVKDFESVRKIILKYGGIEYAINTTKKYTEAAKGCLNAFGASPYKEALLTITDYMLSRKT
ncbi:MAG: polyprenyl synthetase family protein [Proteobacteria bacterium]|nr:polyprenyl synthetase family protein [Pseudomonadota bacterium]